MAERPKSRLWWPAVVALVLGVCLFALYRGAEKLQAAQAELEQVVQTNQRLDRENRALYRQVMRLRSDPQALEREARREMGMVGQDEVVYQEAGPAPSLPPKAKE